MTIDLNERILLSRSEFEKITGISRSKFIDDMRKGVIPTKRISGKIYVPTGYVKSLMEYNVPEVLV